MNHAAMKQIEEDHGVTVFFTCIVCGKLEEIVVPRDTNLPMKVYWECYDCRAHGESGEESRTRDLFPD